MTQLTPRTFCRLPSWFTLVAVLCGLQFVSASWLHADEPAADYTKHIKPLLRERCYACHGGLKQEAGLRLDTAALLRQGSAEGPIFDPSHLDESRLLRRLRSTDLPQRMPPEGKPLTDEQITTIARWLSAGAAGPPTEVAERDPRDHWSFRPPSRGAVPNIAHPEWARGTIDRYLAASLDERQLAPRRPASRETVLRRVYLDLTGLPPSRDALHEYLANPSVDALEREVDRLLASPAHGQRWGRHWMDVWRYSDWFGRRMVPDVWNSAPQIWRWRDWIVDSLNGDSGYDRMVQSMLAADEMFPEDDRAAVATGYLIRNWYALNPNLWMRDNVEHTAKAFLGLTFNCAHCHDHKYDPIAQVDYFRLRAFFEPIGVRQDRVPGEPDPGKFQEYDYSVLRKIVRQGMVRIFDKNFEAPTWFYTGGDERNRVKERGSIPPGLPHVLGGDNLKITPVELPPVAWYPGFRREIQATEMQQARAAVSQAEAKANETRAAIEPQRTAAQAKVAAAEQAFQQAVNAARAAGQPTALAGKQSLILSGGAGRRALSSNLPGLKALPSGSYISFQLRILKDTHVNFQLAKDTVKGLTATCVAFEGGRITSYQPGGFTEFPVGKYDFAAGQNWFDVRLTIDSNEKLCLLRVTDHASGAVLVEQIPVAWNDWNPVGNPIQAISFDARTGSLAAVDNVQLSIPKSTSPEFEVAFAADFEAPKYTEGRDVAGIDGWEISPFGQPPATSQVASVLDVPAVTEARDQRSAASRALEVIQLQDATAQAQAVAAQRQFDAVVARIAADQARWSTTPNDEANDLVRRAVTVERTAQLASTEATLLAKRHALYVAEQLPAADANRTKNIQTATQQLNEAQSARDKAITAVNADATPADDYAPLSPVYTKTSTGRRRALATWLTQRDNPLTARVAVNHIWLRHFHEPIVATVFDFGRNGATPTHPALLDCLAVDLMESGWSMKSLHRQIVLSAAYQQSSNPLDEPAWPEPLATTKATSASASSAGATIDSENRLLWHMRIGRLEAEVVRDGLLSVAGLLDIRLGGQELENSEALTTRRRTLYYSCHPEVGGKNALGELFDAPEPTDCYRRTRSVTPQQALALTNSPLAQDVSGALASRIAALLAPSEKADASAFVIAAHEQILSRGPTPRELELCLTFLTRQATVVAKTEPQQAVARARESLVRALLNHNDFLAIR